MKTITVPGGRGFDFLVRLVERGDTYGLEFCLTHNKDEPLVEFYDTRHQHTKAPDGQMLGQFVSRYSRGALDGVSKWSAEADLGRLGLNLCGYEPSWKVGPGAMQQVLTWLKEGA
jgi:hypothetical protein